MRIHPKDLTDMEILNVHMDPIFSYRGPLRSDPTITAIVRMLTKIEKFKIIFSLSEAP